MKKPTILIDTREDPDYYWKFKKKYDIEVTNIKVGDYSLKGYEPYQDGEGNWHYEDALVIERKTLNDLMSSLFPNRTSYENKVKKNKKYKGKDIEELRKDPEFKDDVDYRMQRFVRAVEKLKMCNEAVIIVEAEWRDILNENYKSNISPDKVEKRVISLMRSVPVVFADTRRGAARTARDVIDCYPNRLKRKKRREGK